jgi:hypothetical protein
MIFIDHMSILREHIRKILKEETSNRPENVKDFQDWVKDVKNDPEILGPYGADGSWGKFTSRAWEKYGQEYEKSTKKEKQPTPKSSESDNVILMGGLDYRPGDLNISQQVSKLKNNLSGKNITGFRYKDLSGALQGIKDNPNSYVILFSAGCNYSSKIADVIKDKNKLFIVEPYALSAGVTNSVNSAVSSGVPNSNVVVGPIKARGLGVVPGSTKTPSSYDHWGALEFVSNLIK